MPHVCRLYFLYVHITIVMVCVPSCVPHYQQSKIRPVSIQSLSFCDEHDKCIVSVHQFTTKQVAHMFNGRGSWLVRTTHPIFPLEIHVTNYRDYTITLDPKQINLSLVSCQEVINRLNYKTHARVLSTTTIGLLTAGGTFLSAAYITILGAALTISSLIKAGYIMLSSSGFMLMGTPLLSYLQIKKCNEVNPIISQDILESVISDEVIIEPGKTVCVYIFVKRAVYKNAFTLVFVDTHTHETIKFPILLPQRKWT